MITNVKEINKEFSQSRKHFNQAIKLAKKSIIIGSITYGPTVEKKVRKKRAKKVDDPNDRTSVQKVPDSELPDMDNPEPKRGRKKMD